MNSTTFREAAASLESILRLQTYPVAVKMLNSADEIPANAKRPVRDLGYHLSTCQVFSMARRQGITLAQLKEDMWCMEPVIGYGMADAPEYFLEGHNRFPSSAKTPEAGKAWAQAFPRLQAGESIGILVGPAKSASFDPDVVMLYCNPEQLTQILHAKNWMDGLDAECKLSGHAACVYAVVPTFQDGKWQITSPCGGDRARAMARHDEMIASFPANELLDLVEGLEHTRTEGKALPLAPTMRPEYNLPAAYVTIGKMMGMDWVK